MKTIVAISTSPGVGGIGIVRMSGEDTFNIINKIFKAKNEKDIKPYTMKYGHIVDPKTKKIIDEVLVSYFFAPKSYTAENMCEINSHRVICSYEKNIRIMFRKWRGFSRTTGNSPKKLF